MDARAPVCCDSPIEPKGYSAPPIRLGICGETHTLRDNRQNIFRASARPRERVEGHVVDTKTVATLTVTLLLPAARYFLT
jgi:hypothetical protein